MPVQPEHKISLPEVLDADPSSRERQCRSLAQSRDGNIFVHVSPAEELWECARQLDSQLAFSFGAIKHAFPSGQRPLSFAYDPLNNLLALAVEV